MELVHDEVIESGRTEASVVPRIVRRGAYYAIAIWIPVELELARVWVALEAFTARSDDIEAIEVTVFDPGHKASPNAGGIFHEQVFWILREERCRDSVLLPERDVDLARCRRPGAEGRSAGHEVGPEWRARGDVQLGCGHRGFSGLDHPSESAALLCGGYFFSVLAT